MLEESAGQRLDQVLRQLAVGRMPLHRGADLGHRLDRADDRQPGRQMDQPAEPRQGAGVGDLVQQDRVGPLGDHRQVEGLGIAPAARDHREDRQVQRLGDRPQVAGMLARAARASRRRVRPASPRPPTARPSPPPGRTGRGRPPAASARGRGAGPASPVTWPTASFAVRQARVRKCCTRQPRWVSPASIARQATDGSGPVALVARPRRGSRPDLRLAVSQDGARWHSSGPDQPDGRTLTSGSIASTHRRHDRAGTSNRSLQPPHPCLTERPEAAIGPTILGLRMPRGTGRRATTTLTRESRIMQSCVGRRVFYEWMRGDRLGRA